MLRRFWQATKRLQDGPIGSFPSRSLLDDAEIGFFEGRVSFHKRFSVPMMFFTISRTPVSGETLMVNWIGTGGDPAYALHRVQVLTVLEFSFKHVVGGE